MLGVSQLEKHLGARTLIEPATFRLESGEKVALVGVNGSGKSTILKMCAGVIEADGGEIALPRDATIGYLPQEANLQSDAPLREELRGVFAGIDEHIAECEALAHRMAEIDHASAEYEKVADRFGRLQHEIDRLGAYEIDARVERVAAGLGFRAADLTKPCSQFSGGWQMRVLLAKLLLQNPDVMLLDEPTNHLDLETMIWLENWIRQSDAAVMLVSHERKFMDALATRVFEIHEGRFSIYKGNYTEYLRLREERWGQWAREYENQQQEIAQLQRFIDRFRYNASKAALVQSRVKALERIERIPPPPRATPSIHFRFPSPDRGNKEVIQTRGLRKSFGSNHVLEGIDFDLYRGEKVALVGLNGAGKTTLLKILAGNLAADGGEIQQGVTVKPAYFAQYDYDGVTEGNSVWSEMSSVTPPGLQAEARRLLGGFFFIGDDVDKPVAVLSGGEKTRLRLAKMLFSGANLLLLDEPTNHLDIASRATLERAMRDYEGTVLFVSHDRAFIDAVATRVVEIKDGALRSFPGNYSDYCHALLTLGETSPLVEFGANGGGGRRARPTVERKEANGKSRERGRGEKPKPKNEERQAQRAEFKQASREKKRVQKLVEELEREIARVERRIGEIDAELAQPAVYRDHTRVAPLAREKEKIEVERAAYMQQWEVQAAKLEKL